MEELEEDAELRSRVALFKNAAGAAAGLGAAAAAAGPRPPAGMDEDDDDDDDAQLPQVRGRHVTTKGHQTHHACPAAETSTAADVWANYLVLHLLVLIKV
jgi:hypothetical protein